MTEPMIAGGWSRALLVVAAVLLAVVGLLVGLLLGGGDDGSDDEGASRTAASTDDTTTTAPTDDAPTTTAASDDTSTTSAPADDTSTTTGPTTTAPAPTTSAAFATTTTSIAIASQAELAGCVSMAADIPADAFVEAGISLDLDGFAGDEVAFTYFDAISDRWVLRVEAVDGSFRSDVELPGDLMAGSRVLSAIDSNDDAQPELLVKLDFGAYSEVTGFAVVDDCEVQLTRNLEGQIFSWPVGASVSNISGFECVNGYISFRAASLTDELVWSVDYYGNVLNGIVWEPIGTAGSTYSGETDDETPPFYADADCASVPSTPVPAPG